MRVIDQPTMLKDGSGWGAMAGVSAALLAEVGFTGAPALTIERDDAAPWWATLGREWKIREQGFKPHGSCWWAQPPIEAALALVRTHGIRPADILAIRVETFEKAVHLAHPAPTLTDEAQYSLPFPVAAALVKASRPDDGGWYGLGPDELLEDALADPETRRLAAAVTLVEDPALTARFPGRFLARVELTLADGRCVRSPETTFRGELDDPLTDDEVDRKARWLAEPVLGAERTAALLEAAWAIEAAPSIAPFLRLLAAPPALVP